MIKTTYRALRLLAIALLAVAPAQAPSAETGFDEGIEYQRITPAQPTRVAPGKVEVVELFWYGCPHCYTFEPHLNKWLQQQSEHVEFRRIPAQLNPHWQIHAMAYYVAEELGILEQAHADLFHALQEEKRPLADLNALADFFQKKYDIDRERFLEAANSFAVRAKLTHAGRQVQRYGASSVPTMVVNGKYLTTAPMAGGSYEGLLKVVDHLIAKEREAQAKR